MTMTPKGNFCWDTGNEDYEGPYCLPCYIGRNRVVRPCKITEGQWEGQWVCPECNRILEDDFSH
jgi:hypothetical protein